MDLWPIWLIMHDRRDAVWILRLDPQRPCIFHLVLFDCLLSGHCPNNTPFRNLVIMLWEGQFTRRSYSSKPRYETDKAYRLFQSLTVWVFLPESSDIVGQRWAIPAVLCLLFSIEFISKITWWSFYITRSGVVRYTAIVTGALGDTWVKVLNSKRGQILWGHYHLIIKW